MARRKKQAEEEAPPPLPAFYVADADLFIGDPESGAMPVAAFRAGDRVPAAMVEAQGWGELVRDPSAPADEEDTPAAQTEAESDGEAAAAPEDQEVPVDGEQAPEPLADPDLPTGQADDSADEAGKE